jgi:uncharacterized protein with PQ loop repeat
MAKYSFLATISLMFNVFSFASLLMSIHITKNTSTYNWLYLIGNVIAQILLIIYGILNNAPEVYGPTILLVFGLLYIVYIKFTYHYDDEKNL